MSRRSRFHSPPRSSRYGHRLSLFHRTRFPLAALLIITFLYYHYHNRSSVSSNPSAIELFPYLAHKSIDWSSFAYTSYATSNAYLCNSLLLFDALHRYGSKADRVLFYPDFWDTQISGPSDRESQLLIIARDTYNVKLMPVDMDAGGLDEDAEDEDGWGGEGVGNTNPGGGLGRDVIRFLAWDQTQYDRVIHLDSDVTLQRHLDELFLLPKTPIAMPRAYWSSSSSLTSSDPSSKITNNHYRIHLSPRLILLEPSRETYNLVTSLGKPDQKQPVASDSALYTSLFAPSALILPHQVYMFPVSELRTSDHSPFFGSFPSSSLTTTTPTWDIESILSSAAVIHFLDNPFPKPWIMWPREMLAEEMPICEGEDGKREACQNKERWFGLYDDFRKRRKDVCKLLTEMAPKWEGGDKGRNNATRI